MRDAAEQIAAITRGKSIDDYLASRPMRWSVERGFEIIGEALSQLRKSDASTASRISEFRKIISFRNVLIHAYSQISDETTWDIVQHDLPVLWREVEGLLNE